MKVSIDVYTKNVDAALAVFKSALETGAIDMHLRSSEDYNSGALEYLNLMFRAEHTSPVLKELDEGPFVDDSNKL